MAPTQEDPPNREHSAELAAALRADLEVLKSMRIIPPRILDDLVATTYFLDDAPTVEHRRVSEARAEAAVAAVEDVMTDPVTGLLSRAGLTNVIGLRRPADGNQFVVLIIDLDQFKPVNDVHGHQMGDEVLEKVGDRLRTFVRNDLDEVARWGGDEFVILAEWNTKHPIAAFAARISDAIEADIALSNGATVNVGASIGYEMVADEIDFARFVGSLQTADEYMFRNKERRHVGTHAWNDLQKDPAVADDIAFLQGILQRHSGGLPEHMGSMLDVGDRLARVHEYVRAQGIPLTARQVDGHLIGRPTGVERRGGAQLSR